MTSRADCALAERRAGAIAIGEASEAERAAYCKHLAGCSQCLHDLGGEREIERVMNTVARARDDERWEPELRAAVLRRPVSHRAWIWAGAFAAAIVLGIAIRATQAPHITPVHSISASESRALAALNTQTAPRREGHAESLRVGAPVSAASLTVGIDAQGRPVRCTVVKSSGDRTLDESICRAALHPKSP
jgi:anti-sigma factor RsiW